MRLYIRQKGHKYKFFEVDNEEEIYHGLWESSWRQRLHSKIFDKDNQELATITLTKAPAFWRMNKTTYQIRLNKEDIDIEVKAANGLIYIPMSRKPAANKSYKTYAVL